MKTAQGNTGATVWTWWPRASGKSRRPRTSRNRLLPGFLRRNALCLTVLLFALPLMPGASLAQDEIAAQQSGNLLLRMQDGYRVATRLNTDVEMKISGMTARVGVLQRSIGLVCVLIATLLLLFRVWTLRPRRAREPVTDAG